MDDKRDKIHENEQTGVQEQQPAKDQEPPVVVEEIPSQNEENAPYGNESSFPQEEEDEKEETKDKKSKNASKKTHDEEVVEPQTQPVEVGEKEVNTENVHTSGYSTKSLVLMFIAGAILSGLVMGGILYFNSNITLPEAPEVKETLVVSNQEPTPTQPPVEEVDLSQYKVQILNGSGVAGIAGGTRDIFEEEGFESIDVGNAASQDYQETEVSMKEGLDEELFERIKRILSDYEIVEADLLDESSEYDIIITIGREKSSQ